MILRGEGAQIRAGDGPWIPVTGFRMEVQFEPPGLEGLPEPLTMLSDFRLDIPLRFPEDRQDE